MNKNLDLCSKKFLIVFISIFIVFFLIIIRAFNDLISYQSDSENRIEMANINNVNNAINLSETAQQDTQAEQNMASEPQKEELNLNLQSDINITEELQPIKELPNDNTINTNPSITQEDNQILNAQKLKKDKQYVKALEDFDKIASQSNNNEVKAKCYEEIADIYGIVKRYGSALAYAQKAYNIEPTSYREMQIARLYYKTGEIDKATKRINNILQRDFSVDN